MTAMVFGKASDAVAGEFAQGAIGITPNVPTLTRG